MSGEVPVDQTYRDPNRADWINPYDFPKAWRCILLDGYQSPGIVSDVAGSNPRKWDKREGTGQSGATIVYSGDGLAEFSIKVQLGWRSPELPTPQEQFAEWDTFKVLLVPPTTKNPAALTIFHPNLALLPVPITAVVVQDVIGPKQVASGVWEWEIKFLQFRAPKPAGAKSGGAKGSGGTSKSSGDATDALIDSLSKELGDLAK